MHTASAQSLPLDAADRGLDARDRRIRDIRRLIDSGRYDLLSLDVFGTFVWRMAPAPADVFFLAANKLIERGAMRDSSSAGSFVLERIQAEERARKRRTSPEVTLDEIYLEFPKGYLLGIVPEDVARIEFETEIEVVRVNPAMREIFAHARDRGMKTAFVSDTYFSRAQIRALVGVDADRIVLSSEERVSKYQGLHRVLIEKGGVPPERILHVGDNYIADIEGPAVFGIERFWFRPFPDEYEGMIESELPQPLSRRAAYFESDDCGMTALRGRAMFACDTPYEEWGAGVLGPVVTGFCDWVTAKCRALGITTALCLMREGRILKQVIDGQGTPLLARELFVSRYAALKASIFSASEEELRGFVYRPSPQKRGAILEQLGLDPGDIGDGDPDESLTPVESARLIRRISRSAPLREKIVRSSAVARARLLRHLASLVPMNGKIAFVDLGYKGTIQDRLQRIFEHEGIPIRSHGLYLVTGCEVHKTQSSGAVVEGWLAENGQPVAMAHSFVRSPEIVEQSLMADCGTTLSYTEAGEPILDACRVPAEQRAQIAEIQKGIRTYASLWAEHTAAFSIGEDRRVALKAYYQSICIRSVARPLDVEIGLFGEWRHDENFGSKASRRLLDVVDMNEWEKSHISAHQIASLPPSRVYWPFGFARTIGPGMAEAVASIYQRSVGPEAFDSCEPPRHMVFYWDSGQGFNLAESRVCEYRLNNRGRVWHRFSLEISRGCNRMFGLTIGLPGEIVRLTGAIVRSQAEDEPMTIRTLPHDAVQKEGYERLHDNLYLVKEDPALFVIPTDDLTDFTGTVSVDVFFSIVSTGSGS